MVPVPLCYEQYFQSNSHLYVHPVAELKELDQSQPSIIQDETYTNRLLTLDLYNMWTGSYSSRAKLELSVIGHHKGDGRHKGRMSVMGGNINCLVCCPRYTIISFTSQGNASLVAILPEAAITTKIAS